MASMYHAYVNKLTTKSKEENEPYVVIEKNIMRHYLYFLFLNERGIQ